jgi:uncharacterized phiE125 gp8 family phage protein
MAYRPRNRVVSYVGPSGSVVSVADMRAHLRLDPNDTSENAVVTACEAAAVRAIEARTQRLLISRQVTLRLPGLPGGRHPVELPGGLVSAVDSVTADGVEIEGAEAYGASPAVLVPASDWPAVTGSGYPVQVVYTAGFPSVPLDLVAAVKMWAGHFFEHREAVGPALLEVPLGVEALISPYRISPA